MNPIQSHANLPTAWALPDVRRVAQDAIANHDQARFQQMLDAQEVDANTRTSDGATLLIEAVRSLNVPAFSSLVRASEAIDLNEADADGNTMMHHVALRMTDEAMDNAWEAMLTTLLEERTSDIEWDLVNLHDQTVLHLMGEDGRERIAELIFTYAPEPSPTHSAHADSDTNEEIFSDLDSEHFENLTPQQQARFQFLHEQFLQRKRER